jgi:hypothetical protein
MSRLLSTSLRASFNGHGVLRSAKNLRNALMDHAFRATGHAERDRFLAGFSPRPRAVVFTIAFNTPWVIDLLTASWSQYVSDAVLVVADNSSDRSAREAHARICRERGVAYVDLPRNREWSPNRSHAIALNWVYYNLIEALEPEIFGFVDHDCFPTQPVSVYRMLEGHELSGWLLRAVLRPDIWYLWPGFCFYRFHLMGGRDIDFRHAIEWQGDTGVMNWEPVYSRLDVALAREAPSAMVAVPHGAPVREMQVIDGTFNHIGAASYTSALARAEQRRAFADYLWQRYLPGHERLVTP